jgi:hypothetical protein
MIPFVLEVLALAEERKILETTSLQVDQVMSTVVTLSRMNLSPVKVFISGMRHF